MKVYVTTAKSESGDDYGPFVFSAAPSMAQVEAFWRKEAPQEFTEENDGPSDWGSYLTHYIAEVDLLDVNGGISK